MSKKLFILLLIILVITAGYFVYGAFATSNPHTWTNGLVGYWSFDGQMTTSTAGTRDVSNNGNWCSNNGTIKTVGGISGQALLFDGATGYLDCGSGSSLDITTGNFSFEAWAKTNYISTGAQYIISKRVGLVGYEFDIHSSGSLQLFLGDSGGWSGPSAGSDLRDGKWHHLIVTVNRANNATFYIDGVNGGTAGISARSGSLSNAGTMKIGRYGAGASEYFNGSIDEVRVYNRVLTADEVKQHYDQTRRNFVINNPSGTPPVGWWKMDEATGATVRDYSVNANNGTPTGTASVDGKIGKALSFDGADDYVDCGNPNLDWNNISFTVEAWAKLNSGSVSGGIVGNRFGAGATNWWTLGVEGAGELVVETGPGESVVYMRTGVFPAGLGWKHYVAVKSGTNFQIFIDGVSKGTGTITGNVGGTTNELRIGRWFAANQIWNGLIDDVRIYNYARTADQIASDYRAGAYRTIVGTSVPSTWWTDGLVGYWNFDGQNTTTTSGINAGTKDATANNNWGKFYGGVGVAGGVSGQALKFDGVNDYVDAGNGASLQLSPGNLTIEAWVYPRTAPAAGINFVLVGSTGMLAPDTKGYEIAFNGSTNRFRFLLRADSATGVTVTSNNAPTLNTWQHIVAVNDGGTMKMYVNGVQQAATGTAPATFAMGRNLIFGEDLWGDNFDGLIDEVRIYSRALSADEVMTHYQQTRRNLGI